MIRNSSRIPITDSAQAPSASAAQPVCPNSQEPRNPPAIPVKNGCPRKKLLALYAGDASTGLEPGERAISGEGGGTLRLVGPLLFSWARGPGGCPILDGRPPAERPARVSARVRTQARLGLSRLAVRRPIMQRSE